MSTELAEAPDEVVVDETPSLRETIEEAVDATEDAPAGQPSGDTPPVAPQAPQEGAAQKAPADTAGKPAGPASSAPTPPGTPGELKAPAQWKPHVREKWNQLPREVQEEITRREGDSMRLIGSVGQKIRFADEVSSHIQPFQERLHANGIAPTAFVGDIFTSVKHLANGSMQEKADVVANIVQAYGVDLRTLDAVLTGRMNQAPEVLEARRQMARANSIIHQQQSNVQHQTVEEAERSISAFAADEKHEFFDDVRDLMADLVESGRANDLEEAYSAAVWANPETRKILLQRESEARIAVKQNRAGAARRASSSVGGAPRYAGGAGPLGGENASLRDTISAAFDAQESA